MKDTARPIPLTQGFIAWVDAEDFDRINEYRWKILKAREGKGTKLYACRNCGRTGKAILMHREIIAVKRGMVTDHKDGDGLNNRRANLREATNRQNLANVPKRRGKSKYKGVHWSKERKKWVAQIADGYYQNGKQRIRFLGRFDCEKDAASAYDRKAVEMHGDFAVLNLPENR